MLTQAGHGSPSLQFPPNPTPPKSDSLTRSEETVTLSSEPLATFTLFPKLPIELRLKIWRASFPRGREVNFAAVRPNASREDEVTSMEDDSPLPATLSVNRESRHETLKHYLVVLRDEYNGDSSAKKQKPFVYNPKLDIAWLAPFTVQEHYPAKWLDYLQSKAPKAFSDTMVLEIRFWDWNFLLAGYTRNPRLILDIIDDQSTLSGNRNMKPFLRFENLESVKMLQTVSYSTVHAGTASPMGSRMATRFVNKIRDWFKDRDSVSGGAPMVTMQ